MVAPYQRPGDPNDATEAIARMNARRAGDGSPGKAGGARIVAGNVGDHPLVMNLLAQIGHGGQIEDFQARLDHPHYQPSDRLLLYVGAELAAHVHATRHAAWFEGVRVALAKFENLAVLPEYRLSAVDDELIAAAETAAAAEGAVVAVVDALDPAPFERRGWSRCRAQGHTRANARAVLAHLEAQEQSRQRRRRSMIRVRTWRHFELDCIRALYESVATGLWGSLVRSEATWQWLIGRKAQDQVLLAAMPTRQNADASAERDEASERVVGYAATRGSCILEMATHADRPAARLHLLKQACRDAIDRDHHSISLYTPAADPLHELLVTAGGAWIADKTVATAPRRMMRLLAPERWIDRGYSLWSDRAAKAGVARPLELVFFVDGEPWRLSLTRRSARLDRTTNDPGTRIECDHATFQSLLLGNLAITPAIAAGRLRLSSVDLAGPLNAIFPARIFWQSPLDGLRP
jgi:predicted acetyltransferase